jgi:hypothetical protein
MSTDEQTSSQDADPAPAMEQATLLDAFVECLLSEQRPVVCTPGMLDTQVYLVAAQMRLLRPGVDRPTPTFLRALAQAIVQSRDADGGRPAAPREGRRRTDERRTIQ